MERSAFRTHGITQFTDPVDEIGAIVEEVTVNGFSVINNVISEEDLVKMREKIDAIYQTQIDEIGGEDKLLAINDANVARHLLAYDKIFFELATHPMVDKVLTGVLGDFYVLMSQNALINKPTNTHYQTTWHRDLNYQHFVSSKALAISVLYCIDPFSKQTGGTFLLPGTHKVEKFPSDTYVKKFETVVDAPAGSVIIFDAMLFHRAGNNTSNIIRRAINHIFTAPFILQQISFPKMLGEDYTQDERLRKMLGYETQIPANVTDWRSAKLKKLNE